MNPQDPLAQLRDIHLPEPVTWWPPAPGWWLLALMLLLAALVIARWCWQRYRNNAYRRQAQAELLQCYSACQAANDYASYIQVLNAILKRCVLHCYPAADAAAMSGTTWTRFLDSCWRKPVTQGFSQGPLATAPYMAHWDGQGAASLHRTALLWIKQHRKEPPCLS